MIDFEPVLIQYYPKQNYEVTWVHPRVQMLCKFERPAWAEHDFSEAVDGLHRLYLENEKGEDTYIVFKSKFFDDMVEVIEKAEDEVFEPAASQSMRCYGLSRTEELDLYETVKNVLFGNSWVPQDTKFCESEFYKVLVARHPTWKISFLSSGCVLVQNGDGSYHFES